VLVESEGGDARRLSRRRIVLRRFLRNKTAVVGGIGLLLLVLAALVVPRLLPWGYTQIDNTAFLQPPGGNHPLGTTQAGRDVLALTVEGLRKSLMIGFGVALLQTFVAATIGAFAAYYGKLVDKIALWVIDLLLVVPSFFFIAILSRLGANSGAPTLILILLLVAFGWMLSARVVRSMTLGIKDLEYVKAARYMNVSTPKLVFRHILPNISSLLIIDATLGVAAAVLAETSLSFFGFGVRAPETSLGTLIGEGQVMAGTYPWIFLAPAVVLTVMLICVNFVGDGLRDALDPSSKSGGRA
jgi:peptide/nickel transport system permease protein